MLTSLISDRYLGSHTGISRGFDQGNVLTSSDESFGSDLSQHIQWSHRPSLSHEGFHTYYLPELLLDASGESLPLLKRCQGSASTLQPCLYMPELVVDLLGIFPAIEGTGENRNARAWRRGFSL